MGEDVSYEQMNEKLRRHFGGYFDLVNLGGKYVMYVLNDYGKICFGIAGAQARVMESDTENKSDNSFVSVSQSPNKTQGLWDMKASLEERRRRMSELYQKVFGES